MPRRASSCSAIFTSLHPEVLEVKLYALGVGPILEVGVSGGSDRAELTMFQPG